LQNLNIARIAIAAKDTFSLHIRKSIISLAVFFVLQLSLTSTWLLTLRGWDIFLDSTVRSMLSLTFFSLSHLLPLSLSLLLPSLTNFLSPLAICVTCNLFLFTTKQRVKFATGMHWQLVFPLATGVVVLQACAHPVHYF